MINLRLLKVAREPIKLLICNSICKMAVKKLYNLIIAHVSV